MSLFVFLLSVLGVCLAFGLSLWAYAYWHQNAALDAEMKRLYATKPGHWKPGEPNPVRGFEYQRRDDGTFLAVPVPYPTGAEHKHVKEIREKQQ